MEERLTLPDKKIDGGWKRVAVNTQEIKKHAMTIYWALKKYEDIGYTPEQIKDMNFLYREKCQEVSRLRTEMQKLKERDTAKMLVRYGDEPILRCRHCNEDVTDLAERGFTFCPYCGGRWKTDQGK